MPERKLNIRYASRESNLNNRIQIGVYGGQIIFDAAELPGDILTQYPRYVVVENSTRTGPVSFRATYRVEPK